MKIETHDGDKTVAHLIPSHGRAELMLKSMPKMQSVWNRPGTYLAVDKRELKAYRPVVDALPRVQLIEYDNPDHCVGKALDVLRRRATKHGYDYYVMSDDNCRFDRTALGNLVRATAGWGKPVHMAGFHGLAAFQNKGRINNTMVERNGTRSYMQMSWILRCVPHELYEPFAYPHDLPCYADRYFSFWLISKGYLDFRVTPDAPFSKKRFVQGGIGTRGSRHRSSLGLAQLALDFPKVWGPVEAIIPWTKIIEHNQPRLRVRIKR